MLLPWHTPRICLITLDTSLNGNTDCETTNRRWTGQQGTEKQQGGSSGSNSGICKSKKLKRRGRARKVRFAYEEGIEGIDVIY